MVDQNLAPIEQKAFSRRFGELDFHISSKNKHKDHPELLILSAGFDAHKDDPLADCDLEDEDYGWATEQLVGVAKRTCNGKVVSLLEGGYDLGALTRCTTHHLRALIAD